ncbi:MAG: TMEM175 family protein [Streptosporangiaceae bacterium]
MTEDGLPAGGEEPGPAPGQQKPGHHQGGRHGAGAYGLARSGFIEYDRVLFFSDAVFAIAITVLAVSLRVPTGGRIVGITRLLGSAAPGLLAFGISFAVIGLFWLGHHGIFRYVTAFDRPLIVLNLLFLGTVAFLPYPTEVLSAGHATRSGAEVFYAISVAAAGLAEGAVWQYAVATPGLADPAAARVRTFFTLRIARIPVIFGASIPVALVYPGLGTYVWILAGVAGIVINRVIPGPDVPGRDR